MDTKFLNACKGKSESTGGLNIADFRRELIARYPNYKNQIDTMKRSELNELCRQLTSSAPNPISVNSSSQQVANRCPNEIYEAIANDDLNYIITHYPNLDPNCRIQYISHERRRMNNYLLHIAIIHRNFDIVKYLIDIGADLEVKDDFGSTALLIATDEYDPEDEVDHDIIMLLINRGANIHAQTPNGITPLYHAVIADDVNLTKLLLDNGANINDIYFHNISLLHLASEHQNLDMIRLLLDYGVDPTILDREGRSAENYLMDMEDYELAKFIRNYTSDIKEPADN